ncbi:HutD family protein [Agrobacterium radiobacter]|uniref:HutD/Ves family protein n=1 Tax=Agrobacterium radiobacter TaxID=362 RepID=UPI00346528AA
MKILRNKDHRRMWWKNGGSETTEIAVFPHDADLSAFDWRVSMAAVANAGPFSVFPGVDRTLSIIEGEGMEVDIAEREPVLLTRTSEPLAFPADAATSARLVSGAIVDLNVMTRRGQWTNHVERRTFEGQHRLFPEVGVTLLLPLGHLRINHGDHTEELGAHDCAMLEGTVTITSDMPVDSFLIRITQV